MTGSESPPASRRDRGEAPTAASVIHGCGFGSGERVEASQLAQGHLVLLPCKPASLGLASTVPLLRHWLQSAQEPRPGLRRRDRTGGSRKLLSCRAAARSLQPRGGRGAQPGDPWPLGTLLDPICRPCGQSQMPQGAASSAALLPRAFCPWPASLPVPPGLGSPCLLGLCFYSLGVFNPISSISSS